MSKVVAGLAVVLVVSVVGCSNSLEMGKLEVHTTGNPTANEILTLKPEADIFQFEGVIYSTGIDWVEELTLTKGRQIGEIKTRINTDTNFENDMSNKLPVGAKIFSTIEKEGPILLVEYNGDILK